MLHTYSFSAHKAVLINGEQPEKYLYNQSSHYGMFDCASFIDLKVGMSLNHAVLRFASSFLNMFGNIPNEE